MNLYKKIAKLLGYELINRGGNPSLGFHLKDLMELRKIDLVLDVGGNVGQFAQSLRSQGYNGLIHSFEPVNATFEKLQYTSQNDENWHVHNFAIGEQVGQAQINVTKSSDFSSILAPNEFGKQRFKKNKVEYTQPIEINTIDNFISQHNGEFNNRRIFLKTDTQGFDLQVIAGAANSVNSIQCLLSEISMPPIYDDMPHYIESLKVYEDHGFIPTSFYPITRKKDDLSMIEMDCIMINKNIN